MAAVERVNAVSGSVEPPRSPGGAGGAGPGGLVIRVDPAAGDLAVALARAISVELDTVRRDEGLR